MGRGEGGERPRRRGRRGSTPVRHRAPRLGPRREGQHRDHAVAGGKARRARGPGFPRRPRRPARRAAHDPQDGRVPRRERRVRGRRDCRDRRARRADLGDAPCRSDSPGVERRLLHRLSCRADRCAATLLDRGQRQRARPGKGQRRPGEAEARRRARHEGRRVPAGALADRRSVRPGTRAREPARPGRRSRVTRAVGLLGSDPRVSARRHRPRQGTVATRHRP